MSEQVATYAAMKSGLKVAVILTTRPGLGSSNLCRDEKRTESLPAFPSAGSRDE